MKQLFLLLFTIVGSAAFAQFSIDSLSHIDYQALHGANLNDVWGYTDELGNEYAIVGTSKGTSIVAANYNIINVVIKYWKICRRRRRKILD